LAPATLSRKWWPPIRGCGARKKSQRRTDHRGEVEPIAVQIAGADPAQMAEAARYNVERGAQIIDINMGCPAKKVCNAAAGSALLANEPLVEAIVDAVVRAVEVPVTLKIRHRRRSRSSQCAHDCKHCRARGHPRAGACTVARVRARTWARWSTRPSARSRRRCAFP
jgi:tRNA-dihydrouridine synthase